MNLEDPKFLLLIPLMYLLLQVFRWRGYMGYSSLRRLPKISPLKTAIIRLPRTLWFLAVAFAIIGLCHPQSDLQEIEVNTQGREMIMAIDASFSMTGHAMEEIKKIVTDFVRGRSNDLIGVTIFGTDAALVVLPTQECSLLENSIKKIHASQVGFQTALGEGLFTAIVALIEDDLGREYEIKKLRHSINRQHLGDYALKVAKKVGVKKNRVIVLFTDGIYNVGINPVRPLRLAARLGIKVYVVAVEPSAETGVEPEQAAERIADLKKGVAASGGTYFMTSGAAITGPHFRKEDYEQVAKFYKEIDSIERDKVFLEKVTSKKDLYFYPALLGLVCVIGMVTVENIWIRIP
ncbi:MAG: VWA domain-containing protein [Candidatus Brocadiales bacterium]